MVDPLRHLDVFKPYGFGDKRIDVVGCGATGSRIALSLAKLGISNIHIWDFDSVEEHNIANQAFSIKDIGRAKVEALAEIILEHTGTEVTVHNERVDGTQVLGEIVFLLTDTMASRKEIWEKALRLKIGTRLVIETRMGADSGRIYSINPCRPSHINGWVSTLCDDNEAEVSACGATISVGPTAEIVSGMAVWQLIRWYSITEGKEDTPDEEIVFSLRPTVIITNKY